ncbi:hypothetical protein GW17_00057928 [Ensete ventricosum]|nr:hypothetical protein GW17_00057928 [Ensete ventricosum]
MASVHCWLVRKMASRCCVEYDKQMASGGATTIGDAVHPRGQGGQEGATGDRPTTVQSLIIGCECLVCCCATIKRRRRALDKPPVSSKSNRGFPDRGRGRVYFAGYDFYQSFVNPKEIRKRRELATEDAKAIVPKFILKKRKRE